MIGINANSEEFSLAKGREFLQRGDVHAAVEYYGQVYDPDSVDEAEARSMLIEARSHLSKKHLVEALESFEEALLMGTEVQRRQALEGITSVGGIRSRLGPLTAKLKKGFKSIFGKRGSVASGLALISDEENLVLISEEAIEALPARLATGKRITRLPARFAEVDLPLSTSRCIPYADDDDVQYVLDVAGALAEKSRS